MARQVNKDVDDIATDLVEDILITVPMYRSPRAEAVLDAASDRVRPLDVGIGEVFDAVWVVSCDERLEKTHHNVVAEITRNVSDAKTPSWIRSISEFGRVTSLKKLAITTVLREK